MNRGGNDDFPGSGEPESQNYLTTAMPRPLVVRGGRALATTGRELDEPQGPEINFMAYWHVLVKHRLVIAGAVALALLAGLIFTLTTTPIYRATLSLQIDREEANIVDIEGVTPDMSRDLDFMQTMYSLLRSRDTATRTVRRANLANDQAFMQQSSGSSLGFIGRLFGGGSEKAKASTAPADRASAERRARNILMSGLTINPIRGTRLVQVSYDSPNPAVAAKVANAVGESFIASNLDRRFEASNYARNFLEDKLAEAKTRLEESEKALVAYAQQEQIINVTPTTTTGGGGQGGAEQTASQSLTASDLVSMNNALAMAKSERIKAEQRWRQAQGADLTTLPEVRNSGTIQALRQQQATLQAQYQQKSVQLLDDHPEMLQLKGQIAELDVQIRAEMESARQSIYQQYQVAARQEASLSGQVNSLKSGVMDLRNRSIQYNTLQRDVDTNRSLYDGLLQRYKEIGVAGGVGSNNVSVVDRAEAPRSPFKPNLMINLLIALGVGLMLGLGAAFALESLDETIKVPEDIEGKLGMPLLGAIPMLEKGVTPEEAMADPRSSFSEAYYSVRTALQFSTNEGVPRNILVTSARPSEGKSTTSVALAKNFAKLGMTVLLVDSDLRNPSLHRTLRADSSQGLSNYLTGGAALIDLCQATDQPNLAFIPCGPLPPNPAELLAGGRIRALVAEAQQHFDLLVIDGPPVMGLADAPLLASTVAGTILVIEAGTTRQGLAKAALRRLGLGNARMLGALLSKFSVKSAGYGYGYGYAYNYEYGDKPKKIERKA